MRATNTQTHTGKKASTALTHQEGETEEAAKSETSRENEEVAWLAALPFMVPNPRTNPVKILVP